MKAKISLFTCAAFMLVMASPQGYADDKCLYHFRMNNVGDGRDIKVLSVKGRRLSKTWVASMGGKSKKLGSNLTIPDKGFLDTEEEGDNISPLKINKGCHTPLAFNFKWRCEASGDVRTSSTFEKRVKSDFFYQEGKKRNKYIDSIKNAPNEAKFQFKLDCEGNIKTFVYERSGK